MDISGTPSRTDILRIQITTGGTLAYGTSSPVRYKVLAADDSGIQTTAIVEKEVLTGGYDAMGAGLKFKASQGVFTAGDYWFVDAVAGVPETQNPIRTSMARRYEWR